MDPKAKIKVVQHNTQHWMSNKLILTNSYLQLNPDVTLLDSHGVQNNSNIYIQGYTTYQKNSTEQLHDGSAILIKSNIQHKLIDNLISDVIERQVNTTIGTISIATTYLPPYLPFSDIHKLIHNSNPTYIIGDLNAEHTVLGNTRNNAVGKGLATFLQEGKALHLDPHFLIHFQRNSNSTPDIVLSNNNATHNLLIEPGPIASSDHIISLIITLRSEAIYKKVPARPIYSKTN